MTDIEELSEAFQLLGRYEEYQLKKVWGIMLITFGILGLFFSFLELLLNIYFLLTTRLLIFFVLTLIVVLYTLYRFVSIKRTIKEEDEISFKYDIRFGLALLSMCFFPSSIFLSIFFSFFLGEAPLVIFYPLLIFDLPLLTGALAFLISYFLLKGAMSNDKFRELLFSGLLLLFISIPVGIFVSAYLSHYGSDPFFWVRTYLLIEVFTNVVISICYFLCGFYQLKSASKSLEGNQ